ncbi:MAG: hypothetical protein NTZ09_18135 [Candidatus Hydrogenedentes bacterium]|nr:hypothetical protein [Candidatus Hydrogenedentota bacterium]
MNRGRLSYAAAVFFNTSFHYLPESQQVGNPFYSRELFPGREIGLGFEEVRGVLADLPGLFVGDGIRSQRGGFDALVDDPAEPKDKGQRTKDERDERDERDIRCRGGGRNGKNKGTGVCVLFWWGA